MTEFKLGMKVKAKCEVGLANIKNQTGIIRENNGDSHLVEFFSKIQGHDGKVDHFGEGVFWWVPNEHLTPYFGEREEIE